MVLADQKFLMDSDEGKSGSSGGSMGGGGDMIMEEDSYESSDNS